MNQTSIRNQIIPEPMQKRHLQDVVDLHYKILFWSMNGQLGKTHIYDLYDALFGSKDFFGYVYYHNSQLVGFATATTNSKECRSLIVNVYRKKLVQVLTKLLLSPKDLLGVLESKFIIPRVYAKYETNAEWLTFVTDITKPFLSPFVANKLISAIDQHFKKVRLRYIAQGIKNNPKAIKYYEKLNWKLVETLFIHNIYLYNSGETEKLNDKIK